MTGIIVFTVLLLAASVFSVCMGAWMKISSADSSKKPANTAKPDIHTEENEITEPKEK